MATENGHSSLLSSGKSEESEGASALWTEKSYLKFKLILSGKTLNSHEDFITHLNQRVHLKEVNTEDECDFILGFCTIVSRAGTDIEAAMKRLHNISGTKPVVLVVLHHTFDPECVVPDSIKCVNRKNMIAVDCLFYEDKGLLQCLKNKESLDKTSQYLKEYINCENMKRQKEVRNSARSIKKEVTGIEGTNMKPDQTTNVSEESGNSQPERNKQLNPEHLDTDNVEDMEQKNESQETIMKQNLKRNKEPLTENTQTLQKKDKTLEEKEKQLSEVREELRKSNMMLEKNQTQLKDKERQLESVVKDLETSTNKLTERDKQLQENDKQLKQTRAELDKTIKELEDRQRHVEEKNTQLENLNKLLKEKETQLKNTDKELEASTNKLDTLGQELQDKQRQLVSAVKELDTSTNKLTERDEQLQEKDRLLTENRQTLQKKDKTLEEKEKQLSEVREELRKSNMMLEKNQTQLKDKETQLESVVKELETSTNKLDTLGQELQDKQRQLQDTMIKSELAEKTQQLKEKDRLLTERETQLMERDKELQEKDRLLTETRQQLEMKDETLEQKGTHFFQLKKKVKCYEVIPPKVQAPCEQFTKELKKIRKSMKMSTEEKCKAVLYYVHNVSRAGTDIQTALQKLNSFGDKYIAIVMLHQTSDRELITPDSSRTVTREKTFIVDCLFSEDEGLFSCPKNDEAIKKVAHWLKIVKHDKQDPKEKKSEASEENEAITTGQKNELKEGWLLQQNTQVTGHIMDKAATSR
ncbi:restin homolog isoform X1 [Tachysurus vachellii]|uniref:restin homolog isoform X1 n=1 Tax=Tachysurus vachellii TaxID=175792 RepID=UPI00296B4D6B|nr:restin homolog isoform X1 [Tachysurus vachellii]